MSEIPHGEPYAGKLHVRFDEGADVPCGGVSLYSTPFRPLLLTSRSVAGPYVLPTVAFLDLKDKSIREEA